MQETIEFVDEELHLDGDLWMDAATVVANKIADQVIEDYLDE